MVDPALDVGDLFDPKAWGEIQRLAGIAHAGLTSALVGERESNPHQKGTEEHDAWAGGFQSGLDMLP